MRARRAARTVHAFTAGCGDAAGPWPQHRTNIRMRTQLDTDDNEAPWLVVPLLLALVLVLGLTLIFGWSVS